MAAVWLAAAGLLLLWPTPAAAGAPARTYRPPVTVPIRDPFRPPPAPWLAGNRGIEYATPPGTIVRAIGPGVISFAGRVAGELDVTVTHPDGLRSSYVDLASTGLVRGDRVLGGDVIGRSTDRLHLGVRRGRTYLDPASLWGQRVGGGRVILVPLAPPAQPTLGSSPRDRYHRRSTHRPVGRTQTARVHPTVAAVLSVALGPRFRRNRGRGAVRERTRRDHEAAAGGPGPLRPPDPALEPEDEAVHLR